MVYLVLGALCSVLSALLGLMLQFRMKGWEVLAGFRGLEASLFEGTNRERLRRRISILYYFLSLGLLAGTLAVAVKALSPVTALPLAILLVLVVFDAMLLAWRRYAPAGRNSGQRRGSRLVLALAHVFFAFLIVLLIP